METINADPQAEMMDINQLNEKAIEEIRKAYDIFRTLIKVYYNLYYNQYILTIKIPTDLSLGQIY